MPMRGSAQTRRRGRHKATYPKISTTPKYMENKQSAYGRPAEL
jgi:hypothetical protein